MTPAEWRELDLRQTVARFDGRRALRDLPAVHLPRIAPVRFRWGFPARAPRTAILDAYTRTPPALPGRPVVRLLVEGARSSGKTEIACEVALHRLLDGSETGVMIIGRTPPDSAVRVKAWLDRIPPLRARESPDDPAVRRWAEDPLGQLYPDARISGGVEHAILHVEGRRCPIWSRTPGGSIRGQNAAGIRPSLAILDDIVSYEAAHSPAQTEALIQIVNDDVAGLGTVETPVAIWYICNATAQGDAADRLAASGVWTVIRAPSWAPTVPPDGPHKRELLRLLVAPDATADDTRAYLAAHPDLLGGCVPTDPDADPLALLALEASLGARAFRRAYQCERLGSDERLWPMDRAVVVQVRDGVIHYPDGARLPLDRVRAGVWLDPRGSTDADKNDYAAVAVCVREIGPPSERARRAVLHVALERCSARRQRAMLWEGFDAAIALGIPASRIRLGYETNNSATVAHAEYLRTDLDERRSAGRPVPPAGIEGAWSSKDKYDIDRIAGLEGPIETGRLAFADHLRDTEAWLQCARLPHGEHDDAPDAITEADRLTAQTEPTIEDWAAFMRR